jgi:hypothetical protein
VQRALQDLPIHERVDKANAVLELLGSADRLVAGPRQLVAVARQEHPGVWRLLQTRPRVPLSRPALLTNAGNDPKLGEELRAELVSADRVDLLCAFVKWYGLRVLEEQLKGLKKHGVTIRVLTTTYMGATDRKALDRLVRDFGAEGLRGQTSSSEQLGEHRLRRHRVVRAVHVDPGRHVGLSAVVRPRTFPPS